MLCFVFAALVVLLDQFFKRWIILVLAVGEESVVIPGVLSLFHINNTGAAFSILADQRWLLSGIALIAAFLLIFILLRYDEGFWGTLGLAAVLGGTVGNLIDRLFYGHVVDMFRFLFVDFAIFNIADIFITMGGLTFCVFFIVSTIQAGRSKEEEYEGPHEEYDEQHYDEYYYPENQEVPDYEQFSDTRVMPDNNYGREMMPQDVYYETVPEQGVYYENAPAQDFFYEEAPAQDVYYETTPQQSVHNDYSAQPPDDAASALDALDMLESELDSIEDYDLDDILREYGFEDDKD